MGKKIGIIILFFSLSLLIAGLMFLGGNKIKVSDNIEPKKENLVHTAEPNDIKFYDTVYSFNKKSIGFDDKKIVAGITPHHLLAGDMIAEFYDNLAGLDYDTIILLGPNHYSAGKSKIITSDYDWLTPFGKLGCDRELIGKLGTFVSGLGTEPAVLAKDHSITSQAGFIKKTFPNARFVPLILSPNINVEESGDLAEALLSLSQNAKILLIGSVDFSHYQDSKMAISHDQKSIKAIESFNFNNVYKLDIDSPPAIYAIMKYSEFNEASFKLLNNSNSALLSGKEKLDSATSYVTGYFTGQ